MSFSAEEMHQYARLRRTKPERVVEEANQANSPFWSGATLVLRHVIAIFGLILVAQPADLWASQLHGKLNDRVARRLAAEAVQHGFKTDDFIFEPYIPSGPLFLNYSLLAPPPATWGMYGFFSVNRVTGDVWALWGCNSLSTPGLRKSQAAIHRRFTRADMKQYARLRRLKPFCVYEDTPDTRDSPVRGLAGVIDDIRGIIVRRHEQQ